MCSVCAYFVRCVYLCVCVLSGSKNSVSACLPNWVIGCLLTLGLAFKKRTMSALSLELFTWKSPSGASLTHPHDPRQQNIECISNPAQKYEYKSSGFYWEYLMWDGSLFTVWMYCCEEWKESVQVFNAALLLLDFSPFQRVTICRKCTDLSIIITRKWKYVFYCCDFFIHFYRGSLCTNPFRVIQWHSTFY